MISRQIWFEQDDEHIGNLDSIYGEGGDDYFQATSDTFTLIDGWIGFDVLTIDQVLLENGLFEEISSDAIDVDYGKGTINNLKVQNVTNDAIDFSESYTNVSNVYFENVGDKAISAGENSEIDINNLKILNSYLGIVSKDGSSVNAKNIKISNVTIPFASYIKKNEYKIPKLKVVDQSTGSTWSLHKYLAEILDKLAGQKIVSNPTSAIQVVLL